MKLKSFGCSFIFGSELRDCELTQLKKQYSKHTWPALLAQHNDWDYACHAYPGAGNLRIAEKVLSELTDPTPSVYVISWSWIDRFDHTATSYDDKWRTILPSNATPDAQYYYKHFHSQHRDKLTSLIYVKTVMDAVQAAGHKLIMTHIDELLFEPELYGTAAIELLQNSIQPLMVRFNNQTFLDWAKTNGHKISPDMHPLEDAHRAAADLLISYSLV